MPSLIKSTPSFLTSQKEGLAPALRNPFQVFISRIGVCVFAIVVLNSTVIAKEWRGIVPLKSTRSDVERKFGTPKKESSSNIYYNLAREIVVFDFQSEPCDRCGYGWNVPIGTVVGVAIIPKGTHHKDEYQLDEDSTVRDSAGGAGFVYYSDDTHGLSVETLNDLVTLVEYYPGASEQKQMCPKVDRCIMDFLARFDEYQSPTFEDEKARLDNFVIQIKEMFGRGVIEVIGPSPEARRQRMKRAVRAKQYLVKKRGLEPERLLIVDGGSENSSLTRLCLYGIGGPATRIYVFSGKDPEPAVTTNRGRKRRGKSRRRVLSRKQRSL